MSSKPSIWDIEVRSIEGLSFNLGRYKGQKLLIVNTASACGFTPQYADLQLLHDEFQGKVTVLGFPSNNFGNQEPGADQEIAQFCQTHFGVSFQMFSKIDVVGALQHPLYEWLSTKSLNGWNDQAPNWNFCKYLVDEKGHLVKFLGSAANPADPEILDWVSTSV